MREITRIVLHHTASKDTARLDTPSIRRFHTEGNGWGDIGYHYIVEKVGDTWEAVVGRPLHIQGAHVRGHNSDSIGVAVVGDFEQQAPSPEMYEVLINRIIIPLKTLFPDAEITAHGRLANTKCPGRYFNLEKVQKAVSHKIV